MKSKWTVVPNRVETYELDFEGEKFTIDVKKSLNTGERKKVESSGVRGWLREKGASMDDEQVLALALDNAVFVKVLTWLAAWSLADEDGKKLPLTLDVIKALHPPVFTLIEEKIDEHQKENDSPKSSARTTETPAST